MHANSKTANGIG